MIQGIGPLELVIVLVIVLLIFGPKRLPGLGRQLGLRHARVQGLGRPARTRDDDDDEDDARQPPAGRTPRSAAGEDAHAGRRRGRPRARRYAPLAAAAARPWPPQLRPVAHEDRLSLVEHLDELRTRLIICLVALRRLLRRLLLAERRDARHRQPAAREDARSRKGSDGSARADRRVPAGAEAAVPAARRCAAARWRARRRASRDAAQARAELARPPQARAAARRAADRRKPGDARRRRAVHGHLRVAAYAALLLALPFFLYQAYAFVLPAFSPRERQVALPLMLMVPFLFIARRRVRVLRRAAARDRLPAELQRRQLRHPPAGAGLLPVLDPAPAGDGLLFQIPIGVLAVTRMGIVTPRPAAQEPPLRDPRDRDRGDAAARPGPGDDAADHGPADRALSRALSCWRAARPARQARRAPARRRSTGRRRRRARRTTPIRRLNRCCSTSEAPAAADRQGRLPHPRHPDGRRPRAVRHRRRRLRRPRRRHHRATAAAAATAPALPRARRASRSARQARTRRTPPPGPSSPAPASSSRAPATTTTRARTPSPRAGKAKLRRRRRHGRSTSRWTETSPTTASPSLMVQAYGDGPRRARRSRRAPRRSSPRRARGDATFAQLAVLAYAGQTRKGDLARARRSQLAEGRARGAQGPARLGQGAGVAAGTRMAAQAPTATRRRRRPAAAANPLRRPWLAVMRRSAPL